AFRLGDVAALAKYLEENPHLTPEDTVVAEDAGALCGQVTTLRLRQMLAGAEIDKGGVTMVSGAPEHRRKGVIDRLMRKMLADERRRRVPISGLYPFSETYYARFGYARVEWGELLDGPPALF